MHDAHGELRIKADSFCPAIFCHGSEILFSIQLLCKYFCTAGASTDWTKTSIYALLYDANQTVELIFWPLFSFLHFLPSNAPLDNPSKCHSSYELPLLILAWFCRGGRRAWATLSSVQLQREYKLDEKAIDTIRVECCITAEAIFFKFGSPRSSYKLTRFPITLFDTSSSMLMPKLSLQTNINCR